MRNYKLLDRVLQKLPSQGRSTIECLLEFNGGGIWLVGSDDRNEVAVSTPFLQALGYTGEEDPRLPASWEGFFQDAAHPAIETFITAASEDLDLTVECRHQEGRSVRMALKGRSIDIGDGDPSVHICTFSTAPENGLSGRQLSELEALRQTCARLEEIVSHVTEAVITVDQKGEILSWSEPAVRMFGYDSEDVLGRNVSMLMSGDDAALHSQYMAKFFGTGGTKKVARHRELKALHQSGRIFPIELSVGEVRTSQGHEIIGVVRDITERMEREAHLEYLATHDILTNLPNRSVCISRIEDAVARLSDDNLICAVFFIDLDNFKGVNDRYGHAAGDYLLSEIGARLRDNLRDNDTVSRHGGDEFLAVILSVKGMEGVHAIAQKLIKVLEHPFNLDGETISIGASIGISVCPMHSQDTTDLIRKADEAMYFAKESQGRKYALYSDVLT